MKKVIPVLLALVTVLFFTSGIILAIPAKLQVYRDGKRVPVRTVTQNNEIFVSVSDLAAAFPGQFKMDASSGRLDIYSFEPDIKTVPETNVLPEGGVTGIFSIQDVNGKSFPLRNVSVLLFRSNPAIPDESSTGMIKRWALGKDNSLIETYGKVRETRTDINGRFFMAPIPPGDYEIIAIYYTAEGKRGSFWRRKIKAEKGKSLDMNFDLKDSYSLN
jgi:hypothetical protein